MKFKLVVLDHNEDRLTTKIFVNDNKICNEISSDFFLPHIGKYNLMVGGIGELVILNSIDSHIYKRSNISCEYFQSDKAGHCTCCLIF